MDTKLTNLKDNLEPLFEQFKEMIRVETVVGEAVQLGDTTIVPFVDVSLGLGGCQKAGSGRSCTIGRYYYRSIRRCISWFGRLLKSWRWRSESRANSCACYQRGAH